MSFLSHFKEKHFPPKTAAVCIVGTTDQWEKITHWWGKIFTANYSVVLFGHVIGELIDVPGFRMMNHIPGEAIKQIQEHSIKKVVFSEIPEVLCSENDAEFAYGMLSVNAAKKRYELENGEFDLCVFGPPEAHVSWSKLEVKFNTIYSENSYCSQFLLRKALPVLFYADSVTFDKACNFYRNISIIKRTMFDPQWADNPHRFPQEISIDHLFGFHLRMLHIEMDHD